MSEPQEVDYGQLKGLIGVWKGDKGLDVAPGNYLILKPQW